MNGKKKFSAMVIFIALLIGITTCSDVNQLTDANKLINEANTKIIVANDLLTKTNNRKNKLFSANIQNPEELLEYKKIQNSEAKSIFNDYEKICESLKEISKLFDDVSRMNLNPKYKDYAKLKSDEFNKRAEAIVIQKGNALAFIEIDDPQKMTARFDDNNSKSDKILTEAEELEKKARNLEIENKDVFAELK